MGSQNSDTNKHTAHITSCEVLECLLFLSHNISGNIFASFETNILQWSSRDQSPSTSALNQNISKCSNHVNKIKSFTACHLYLKHM